MRAALLDIKFIGKCFEIYVGRIHFGEKIPAGLRVNIAGCDRHGLDAPSMAGVRRIHRVFGENYRVVVGEGDALAPQLYCAMRDGIGAGLIG